LEFKGLTTKLYRLLPTVRASVQKPCHTWSLLNRFGHVKAMSWKPTQISTQQTTTLRHVSINKIWRWYVITPLGGKQRT